MRTFVLIWCLLPVVMAQAGEPPPFTPQTLDAKAGEVCYAVTLADVDGDRREDVVVVTENRVLWYHNPDWKMRVVIADQTERDNVCIAPLDLDGDGLVEFALGAGWLNNRHLGTLYWLQRKESLDDSWSVRPIGRESWAHRIQWGDVLGTGTPQLILSPLNKTRGEGVRVLAFHRPDNLQSDLPWKTTVLDERLNGMHAHWTGDLDGNGETDLLTASAEGLFWFRRGSDGQLVRSRISAGVEGDAPAAQKTGAGEVKVGRLAPDRVYIAAVEPMHGNLAVIYLQPLPSAAGAPADWERVVLDDTLGRGHAIWPSDLDRDGVDELVLGHSDKGTGDPAGPGVFVYSPDAAGKLWTKHVVDDGEVATEDLISRDLTGDGWPEIVAVGRATKNVRLYLNQGKKQ
jgi:hypothetical protein